MLRVKSLSSARRRRWQRWSEIQPTPFRQVYDFILQAVKGDKATADAIFVDYLAGKLGNAATLGHVGIAGVGSVTVAVDKQWRPPAWPTSDSLTTVIGFEHQLAVSSEAKRAWNGALRILNLLQFAPWFYVGCQGGIPIPPAIRTPVPDAVDGWAEIEHSLMSYRWSLS
jgi:hypothetical protein